MDYLIGLFLSLIAKDSLKFGWIKLILLKVKQKTKQWLKAKKKARLKKKQKTKLKRKSTKTGTTKKTEK